MLVDSITLDTQSDTSLLSDSASTKCLYCASLYRRLCQVKSSHLYLYSAFNNTNCNKALHNIKIGKFVNNVK